MTVEIGMLLGLIGVGLVLFSLEWVPADVLGLGLLIALVLTGLLPKEQAFAGFGSDTVILILGLLILTAALARTGVIDFVGRRLVRRTGEDPRRLLGATMVGAALLSTFMSNTASTAFLIPIAIALAQRARINASRLLLPLAFASILTSSVTLISTTTNLVVSGLITRYDMAPIGMFELAPVGVPIAVVGLLYMFVVGHKLIPERSNPKELIEGFGVSPYLSEVLIRPDSKLVGKTLAETAFGRDLDLTVLRVVRDKNQYFVPGAQTKIHSGDVLLVEGRSEEILKIKETAGIDIKADVKLTDPTLESDAVGLAEAILLPKSRLLGRTLKGYRFRERFGLQVLGINRHGHNLRRKISQIPLRLGDVLLIQGPHERIAALEDDHTLRILGKLGEKRLLRKRAPLAVGIFIGALALATFDILALPLAIWVGVLLVFLTRCISPEEAYREVEWKAIILIGSMLGLGAALDHTGTARYLAGLIAHWAEGVSPFWILSGFFGLTVLLTQPMSNQAAAILVVPIAIETALKLGLNPRPIAMLIAVAASCSYLTPLEPSCLMVYGPGGYRFFDFLKIGMPLTLLIYAVAIWLVPWVWPLQ